MTDTKKNALAELAEEIRGIVISVYYGSGKCGVAEARKIAKAQRIVSELAKVKDPDYADVAGLRLIVMNCRAIAEEGGAE